MDKYCANNSQWWAYEKCRDDDYYACCRDLIVDSRGDDSATVRCHKYSIELERKFHDSKKEV